MKISFICVVSTFAFLASCSDEKSFGHIVHDPVHDIDYVIDRISGSPLSRVKHKIYAKNGNKRELIFSGYGSESISIKPLKEGFVIVEYCGGGIRSVNSFISNRKASGNVIAVEVQPVVIADVEIGGHRICAKSLQKN